MDEIGRSLVVLLPDADGVVGEVVVESLVDSVVLTQAFEATMVSTAEAAPTEPVILEMDNRLMSELFIEEAEDDVEIIEEDQEYEDNTFLDQNELDDDMFDKVECFVLETLPKKEAQSSYSRHVSWIDKKTFNLLKEISYDKRGVLEKDKRFEYELIKSFFILKRVLVNNTIKQHSTEIIFTDIQVDMGTKSDLFHEKNLKRLPND